MRKILLLFAMLAIAACIAAPAIATPDASHRRPILGMIPIHGRPAPPELGSGNLVYHGGPVMRTSKAYAIHWIPPGWSMVSGYRSTINRYFSDSAADSGRISNVYSTLTQYYDTTGPIAYSQTFGGSTTTTDPFPASGCPRYSGYTVCLTDAQVLRQVQRVIAAKGWTAGPTRAFFLFLPKNVGTCTDPSGRVCAFTWFCAYHSFAGTGASEVLYANMPYADTSPVACGTGQRPNGTDADDTLNVASHEHREMINDPLGNAWYDSAGYEGSDKCAWIFGPSLGSTPTGQYNQVIHGHFYYLQEEWTNAHATCVQRGA